MAVCMEGWLGWVGLGSRKH